MWLWFLKSTSDQKRAAQEAKEIYKIDVKRSDFRELNEGRNQTGRKNTKVDRVIPRWKFNSEAAYESGSLAIITMMQSTNHGL
jgi:hypothetical protein